MRQHNKVLLVMTFVITVFMVATTPSAHASFILTLDNLATPGVEVSVTDNGAGDIDPSVGGITYWGSIGVFNLNVTTGVSKPIIGGPAVGAIDLNSINVNSLGSGTLRIGLTDTDFWVPTIIPDQPFLMYSDIAGTTSGTVSAEAYYDPFILGTGNREFPPISPTQIVPITYGPGTVFYGSVVTEVPPSLPYSLTQFVTINHGGRGNTSLDFGTRVEPVPEPGTLLLLGAGLVGLAGYGRFRLQRRKK